MNPIRPLAALVAYLSERATANGRTPDHSSSTMNGRAWRYGNGAFFLWPADPRGDGGYARRPPSSR